MLLLPLVFLLASEKLINLLSSFGLKCIVPMDRSQYDNTNARAILLN